MHAHPHATGRAHCGCQAFHGCRSSRFRIMSADFRGIDAPRSDRHSHEGLPQGGHACRTQHTSNGRGRGRPMGARISTERRGHAVWPQSEQTPLASVSESGVQRGEFFIPLSPMRSSRRQQVIVRGTDGLGAHCAVVRGSSAVLCGYSTPCCARRRDRRAAHAPARCSGFHINRNEEGLCRRQLRNALRRRHRNRRPKTSCWRSSGAGRSH